MTEDKTIRKIVIPGLRANEGYCPCIYESKGKPEYKCPCKEFREKIEVGDICHCGLFIKDSN